MIRPSHIGIVMLPVIIGIIGRSTASAQGACCYGDPASPNCATVSQAECLNQLSGVWFIGEECATFSCETLSPLGACCYGDQSSPNCATVSWNECLNQLGGIWHDGTECATFTCPSLPSSGACCLGAACYTASQSECLNQLHGTWYAGIECASIDCLNPISACCYGDPIGSACATVTESECVSMLGGLWFEGLDCLSAQTGPCSGNSSCCQARVGDANGLGGDEPTIGDASVMIDAKYITGTCDGLLECLLEADVNQSGGPSPTCDDVTIGDISILIDYLFITGPSLGLPDCL